jgi:nucleoside-diphosphate-sugar epimerase
MHESDTLAVDSPLGFYLGTKLCTEVLVQNYRHFFKAAVILRPFFIYGPGQRKDMLIPRLIESVRSGRPIELQGPEGLRLNPVFVEDAVIAFARALHVEGAHVMNVAGPDVLTLREIGESIAALLGTEAKFVRREGTPDDYIGTMETAIARLGLELTAFSEGLRRTLADGTGG